MPFQITLNESLASRRAVPIWLVGSNGTTPATGESGATFHFQIGGFHYGSGGSLSVVSAAAGEYVAAFAASKLSIVGIGTVYYQSANAIPASSPFQVVKTDSYNSQDMGLAAFSEVSIHAGTHSNVTIKGIQNYENISSVTLNPTEYSNVTVRIGLVNYSGATVGAGNIAGGNYSAVTVRVHPMDYSGMTVGVSNIAPNTYSGVTVGVNNIAQSVRSEIADDLLRRSIAAGAPGTTRSVQDAFRSLRNRVQIGASVGTVYTEDDSSSAWTFSITTDSTAVPITQINPAGGSA